MGQIWEFLISEHCAVFPVFIYLFIFHEEISLWNLNYIFG